MYWFTADQHFGHAGIMQHAERNFTNVSAMNNHMVEVWNDTVHGGDIIVIAGDVTLQHNYKIVKKIYLDRLKGNKIIVRGNHDWWDKEKRYLWHRKIKGQGVAVSHYPMRTWKNHQHGWWQLHGHSHGTLRPFYNQLDVGVDVAFREFGAYRPMNMNDIKGLIERGNNEGDNRNVRGALDYAVNYQHI